MSAYDAVVYDLDGTLVRLAVNWTETHRAVVTAVEDAGISVEGESLWELLDRSYAEGFTQTVEAVLAAHERNGARRSERLPTAAELPRSEPVGVCSLNAESACRVALKTHDLDDYVETVVGRDTVAGYKPDPEPLLATIAALDARPERSIFIGDTERDKQTAERAGVAFRFV